MPKSSAIKPTHKAIQQYYQSLKDYRGVGVKHEGAVETAFQRLLEHIAKLHHCQLIPKYKLKVGGNLIYPDGTVFEKELGDLGLRLGYWEAKDIDDDLDKAIASKVASKYPLNNTIFENTRKAVLFQGGKARDQFDLSDKKQLADLLNEFFAYHEPEIANFHDAIAEFKERVPDLAKGLVSKLDEMHKDNKGFQSAFDSFLTVCQQTLNPNISRAAVDEMLVQHLLTERLIRKIFDNPEFMHRNVIAAEIEKVIDALVSHSFNRDVFLKSLDRFYRAIEDAAHTLEDFAEKQHFLNTVYERFFQGYSVKVADTHGIVYTPQEIVDFMCASVEEVLHKEFNLTLGSKGVNILDPCTGTGNFIVNLIHRIPGKDLPRVYKEQLFANEVMLLPYYIAALNIEHAYWERTGQYEAFEGLCFVDSLDMAEHEQQLLSFMTVENTARVQRQKKTPITVIIGNPPYNVGQLNENDNNKNRTYDTIEGRIKTTYTRASCATNKNALSDAYVKFFRWATDRLEGRPGIVCFVSNNGFLEGVAFDGLRSHLAGDFSTIYHFNLKGNARTSGERRRQEGGNIFHDEIRVGIGVTILVKSGRTQPCNLFYHEVGDYWSALEKKEHLQSFASVTAVPWKTLYPDARNSWLVPEHAADFHEFVPLVDKERKSLFASHSLAVTTARDAVVLDFSRSALIDRVSTFIEDYNAEVDRYRRAGNDVDPDDFVRYDKIKWSRDLKLDLRRGKYAAFDEAKIRVAAYRGFCKAFLYYDRILNEETRSFPSILPNAAAEGENQMICVSGPGHEVFRCMATNHIPEYKFSNPSNGGTQCFPFYVYDEDGSHRRENITDWALEQFRTHYGKPPHPRPLSPGGERGEIGKWDIFFYIYGLLHHPGYRTKFADNLKRELPRIPLAPAVDATRAGSVSDGAGHEAGPSLTLPARLASGFWAFADAGRELARLHLDYEKLEPWDLKWIETEGVPLSHKVEDKMRLAKDKRGLRVNASLTLSGIPPEVFQYRLGNRSALDWVIDQYQVSEDKRSGIRSDPNRADDEEYIVRLVGQVVRVSVETVKIVNGLPAAFA